MSARAARRRAAIVRDARWVFAEVYEGRVPDRCACVYQAVAVIFAAHRYGVHLLPQAGTAAWPRIELDQDDGISSTHLAYEWQGMEDPRTRHRIDDGLLPEIHVWAADPVAREIVDLTTRHLPEQCRVVAGMAWEAPPPPDYLWAGAAELPPGWCYEPAPDATRWIAGQIIEQIHTCGHALAGRRPPWRTS